MASPIRSPAGSRAAGLVVALILGKTLSVAGRDLSGSIWLLPALFWQDVAVAAVFWAIDTLLRRSPLMWIPYGLVVAYAAVNVPIARALSSPLTVPMWRAAGGPLLDSIAVYLTPVNLALILAVLVGGAAAPRLTTLLPVFGRRGLAVVAAACLVTGPFAQRRVETRGLQRNAVTALVATSFPRLAPRAASEDWRFSPFGARDSEDLRRYRGAMTGRNVAIVILESTAAQYLASYGAASDPTPNLTALARQAITFEHAYAVYPESIKGLFALLCSRWPALDVSVASHAAAPCDALPGLLGRAGYRTSLFHAGRFRYLGMDELLTRQGFHTLEDAGAIGGNVKSSFGVDEPAVVHRMLSWIDGLPAGQKFLLVYSPVAGHHPYASPDAGPFDVSDELGMYKNALHYGDRSLGALFDGLRTRGLDSRTLIVVFGDHGEAFGQHDGNYGHSIFIYEENVRVPLVIAPPGAAPVKVRRVASVIDITPTILDLLGLPAAPGHEGTSLLEPRERLALFFTDYTLGWLGLRDGCWKFLYEVESRRPRLFDVCADPAETVDRSGNEPARVAAYADRLQRWSAAQRSALTR